MECLCALMVLLGDPEYENFIGVVSILAGTYFGKVDFIYTFLMDSVSYYIFLNIQEKQLKSKYVITGIQFDNKKSYQKLIHDWS